MATVRGVQAGLGLGVALMLVSQCFVMPFNDGIVKVTVQTLPPEQVSFARFAGNFLLLLPLALIGNKGRFVVPPMAGLQILRGLLMVASNLLFIRGIAVVPLAMATSLVFITPLIVAAVAPWALGERADRVRWLAIVAGFIGAMIILRPGSEAVPPQAIYPLCSGTCFAAYLIITRKLAGTINAIQTQTITAAVATAVTLVMLPFVWVTPSGTELALMAVIGALSCLGHVLLTKAHDHAPASVLAPFTYGGIITAITLGWLWFDTLPDLPSIIGAIIVIASGLAILLRERSRH